MSANEYNRLNSIDICKGISVVIMIIANFSRDALNPSDIYFFHRFFSSLSAPIFFFIAGYLSLTKEKVLKLHIYRSLWLLATAVLIDVFVWNIIPFNNFDVLYAIALSVFLIQVINGLYKNHLVVAMCIIVVSSLLFNLYYYRFQINEVPIINIFNQGHSFKYNNIFKRLIFDGWFPLFPWSAISFLGAYYRVKLEPHLDRLFIKNRYFVALTIFIFLLIYILATKNISYNLRDGYIEIFYPVDFLMFLFFIIWVIWLKLFVKIFERRLQFFSNLGRYSLFVYIVHSLVSAFILSELSNKFNYLAFLSFCFVMVILFKLMVSFLEYLRKAGFLIIIPYPIKKLMGLI
jgi:uncharacterized membrane protein